MARKTNGNKKGGSYEREICKRLSLWWTNDERDDIFWRSSQSGGRATQRAKQNKQTFGQYGDVQACDPIGQPLLDFFTIEIKRGYKTATPFELADKLETAAIQMFEKWIRQSNKESFLAESESWALITKRNHKLPMITIPLIDFKRLRKTGAFKRTPFPFVKFYFKRDNKSINPPAIVTDKLCMMTLDDFFFGARRDNILEALKGD